MSAESYKGGEINSQQAEAISTLASANEYKGKSRIITLLELPWGRKWKYFRDQLLARSAAAVAIVCVVIYIAIQVLTPAVTPKLYVAVFNDAVSQQEAATLQSQVASKLDLPEGRKGGVLIDTYFSSDENGISKLQTMIANHEIDVIVATPKTYKELSGYGYLTNLDSSPTRDAFQRFRNIEGIQGFRRPRLQRQRQRQGGTVRRFHDGFQTLGHAEIHKIRCDHRHCAGIAESRHRTAVH